MARKYEMRRRAERVAETRLRITEAAVELHGTVGPARTTISEVARRAGVERLTVYRHFPDETALFRACTGHWLAAHPFPDPAAWSAVVDPDERLRCALAELYAWYRGTERMMGNFFRDGPSVPALGERLDQWSEYLAAARGVLLHGRDASGEAGAAVGHALEFETWRSLVRHGLDDDAAVALMGRLVVAAGRTG